MENWKGWEGWEDWEDWENWLDWEVWEGWEGWEFEYANYNAFIFECNLILFSACLILNGRKMDYQRR